MKASGSENKTNWDEEAARYETIAIQILSAEEDIQEFRTVGLWENQDYYANDSYDPKMTTVHVPFKVSKNTTSVKIKIFRTVDENYLHINKVFVGGLTLPYDNDIESYELDKLDINELYDFDNGVTKVISTGVLGHKVPDKFENIKGSDVVTYEHLTAFLKEWILNSATYNIRNIQGTYSVDPSATSATYTINHEWIEEEDVPVVTLVTPTSASDVDIVGISNVQDCSFDVVLTESPTAEGYAINWSVDTKIIGVDAKSACTTGSSGTSGTPAPSGTPLGNYLHPDAAIASLGIPEDNIPEPASYVSIFDYQS
jgi:hypothetical protein